jgi:GT2 family glycosyltransferase
MISVIVATYNRSSCLKNLLQSLAQLRAPVGEPWELIVVDNKSTDDTADVVRRFAAGAPFKVTYIFESCQGLSHARNTGVKAASGEILVFTDDDVTVDPNWLRGFEEAFSRFDCAGVGGKIVPVWSTPKPSWLHNGSRPLRYGAIVSFDQGEEAHPLIKPFVGANMAFKKKAFDTHGKFRTDLGKRGTDAMLGEDTELCLRLMHHGQALVYAPGALVYHPVPEGKLKTRFRSHYLSCGRFTMRMEGVPQQAILWFGVPRYMVRELFARTWNWFWCFGSERFRLELEAFEVLGKLWEARRLSHTQRGKYHALAPNKES